MQLPSARTAGRALMSDDLIGATPIALLSGKTVEQPIATSCYQTLLAAVPGHMGRIPGSLEFGILAARAITVADHRAPKVAARPIVASQVKVPRKRSSIGLRAGQHVVHGGPAAHAIDGVADFR
jgi:hypothetical protein